MHSSAAAQPVEMPGLHHYDTGVASPVLPVVSEPAVVYREPAVVYREPAVVYPQPTVVYRDPAVVYYGPTSVYRSGRDSVLYNDHGQ